jgi:hypothetical protein
MFSPKKLKSVGYTTNAKGASSFLFALGGAEHTTYVQIRPDKKTFLSNFFSSKKYILQTILKNQNLTCHNLGRLTYNYTLFWPFCQ